MRYLVAILPFLVGCTGTTALAQTISDAPLEVTPLMDARLRYETVASDSISHDANALTARMRAGWQITHGPLSLLAESEATLAIVHRYNSSVNGRLSFPLVADPQNVELNRLQMQYRGPAKSVVTLGRQRINLDDQRFVGAVGWRQNEQTFDAIRIETVDLAPVSLDISYAWSDRTIFGFDSRIQAIAGDNLLANAGVKLGAVSLKGFAYLVDQDAPGRRQFSSQTYGARTAANLPLADATSVYLVASYARQSDWRNNPYFYSADYWLGELMLKHQRLALTLGYEILGAGRNGAPFSFQTPLATGHKFQGWSDMFLTTPVDGIRDQFLRAGYTLPSASGLSLLVGWHRFTADRNPRLYGTEWNAQLGFKPVPNIALLAKYAGYNARHFATDTRKFWLQLDYIL